MQYKRVQYCKKHTLALAQACLARHHRRPWDDYSAVAASASSHSKATSPDIMCLVRLAPVDWLLVVVVSASSHSKACASSALVHAVTHVPI